MVAIGCYCLFVETPPQVVAQLLPSRLLLPQHCHTSGAYYCHNLQISKNKCSPEKSSATVGLSGEGTKVVNDPMKPHQLIWQFCSKCVTLKFGQSDNTITQCTKRILKSKLQEKQQEKLTRGRWCRWFLDGRHQNILFVTEINIDPSHTDTLYCPNVRQ